MLNGYNDNGNDSKILTRAMDRISWKTNFTNIYCPLFRSRFHIDRCNASRKTEKSTSK